MILRYLATVIAPTIGVMLVAAVAGCIVLALAPTPVAYVYLAIAAVTFAVFAVVTAFPDPNDDKDPNDE